MAQPLVAATNRTVLAEPSTKLTAREWRHVADGFRARWPGMAALLDGAEADVLADPAFPAEHRRRIRTTNGVERLNHELKRRTRVVRIFPNRASLLRLVTALAMDQSDDWVSGRRYLDMTVRATLPTELPVTQLAAAD